jgi:hypothetical protein
MSATVVIAIKPFQSPTDKRGEELKFFKVGVEALLSGADVVLSAPDYASSPVALEDKPGFFKRLYGQPLSGQALSARIAADFEMRLKAIAGWQDKLRRIIWAFINPETQGKKEFRSLFEDYLYYKKGVDKDYIKTAYSRITRICIDHLAYCEEYGLTEDLLAALEKYAKKLLFRERMKVAEAGFSIIERDYMIRSIQDMIESIVPATREMLFV